MGQMLIQAVLDSGDCRLAEYPLKVEEDAILVSVDGVEPLFAHS